MPPRNNQVNWEAITGNLANIMGLNPALQAKQRQMAMAQAEHEDNRALIAARLATEGMRPAEIAATIAKLNSETGFNSAKTEGVNFTNAAQRELWNSPDNVSPTRLGLAGLNAQQITGAEADRQKAGYMARVAEQGIGTPESGPNYNTLALLAAAGGNPSLSADVFHQDPNRKWYSVNGSLVNPAMAGAVGGQSGGGMQIPGQNVVMPDGKPMPPGGFMLPSGEPMFPSQQTQSPVPQMGMGGSIAGIITPPDPMGGGRLSVQAGAAGAGGVKASDFNTYENYFRTMLERFNTPSNDGKSYEQILLPEQADTIAAIAHSLMAPENAQRYGITNPQQALEVAYQQITGSRMPTAEDNVIKDGGAMWFDKTQGRKIVNYDQAKADQLLASLRGGVDRSMGVDPDLIAKAIGNTATPGTTGMLPGAAMTPSTIAGQVTAPQQAANQPPKGSIAQATPQNSVQLPNGGFTIGGVEFNDGNQLVAKLQSGEMKWDPQKPLLASPKDGSGGIIRAWWNPARGKLQDKPPVMESDTDLTEALDHLSGNNESDMLGGWTGRGKPFGSVFRPTGAYEDSVETALQAALQRGLINQDAYDMAVSMDSQFDAPSGKGASGLRTVPGHGNKGNAYYRANLLQQVLPDLLGGQAAEGRADVRIGDWASGKWGASAPTEALKVAEQMGIDKAKYGIPDDPWTGIGAAIAHSGYSNDKKAMEAGLQAFFRDVMSGQAGNGREGFNIVPNGTFGGEGYYSDGSAIPSPSSMPKDFSADRQAAKQKISELVSKIASMIPEGAPRPQTRISIKSDTSPPPPDGRPTYKPGTREENDPVRKINDLMEEVFGQRR